MSCPPPQPKPFAIEDLLRRYDGPVPAEDLLSVRTGEPAERLRLRAISREIDRTALALGRSLAAHGEDVRLCPAPSRTDGPASIELCGRLIRYRMLGLRLAERLTGC
jgi:hypothetical protein